MEEISGLSKQSTLTRHGATQHDMSRHTLTIKQAADLFATLGVPRSPRSVQRFCELQHLDCILVKGEKVERYFVDPASIERYAEELKQLENISQLGAEVPRHDATQRDTTRHVASAPVAEPTPEPASGSAQETPELRNRVDTLEKENMQLKIDLSARVIVINQMADERRGFFEQVTSQSREIGRLEMQVHQLEAPKVDLSRHDATEATVPATVIDTGQGREVADAEPTPVLLLPVAQETRPGFFARMFGKR